MGLMDVLNGMANGPRGEQQPGQGGMSPMTMALLGLLAWKAYKKFGEGNAAAPPAGGGGAWGQGSQGYVPEPGYAGGGGIGTGGSPGGVRGGGGGLVGGYPQTGRDPAGSGGGGLGGFLPGGLGGLLAGGAAGSILSGGLSDLLQRFQQSGQGDAADSWVGNGPNQPVSPGAIENALGDRVDELAQRFGIPRNELLQGLSQHLPEVINYLTPHGRVPTEQELSQRL